MESSGKQLNLTAENAALGIDLGHGQLAAYLLVSAQLRIGAGERIVEPDLDRLFGKTLDDKRTCNLHGTNREPGFQERATAQQ